MTDGDDSYLELMILGAGPAYSDVAGSLGSSYLVRTRRHAVLLDLGQGCFPSLASEQEPSELSAVFISHLHPDHFIDLIPLRHYLQRAEAHPIRRLTVLAPAGLDRRLDGAYDTPGFSAAAFDHHDLGAGALQVGPFTLEMRPVTHAGESFAVRASLTHRPDRGIVYTGDIADTSDVHPLIRPGDVLLSEATFGPGPVPDGMPHIDADDVGRLAAETDVGQVIVTHVRMGVDLGATMAAVRTRFPGAASMARPGARYLIPVG